MRDSLVREVNEGGLRGHFGVVKTLDVLLIQFSLVIRPKQG
jgi:hypothetical protein